MTVSQARIIKDKCSLVNNSWSVCASIRHRRTAERVTKEMNVAQKRKTDMSNDDVLLHLPYLVGPSETNDFSFLPFFHVFLFFLIWQMETPLALPPFLTRTAEEWGPSLAVVSWTILSESLHDNWQFHYLSLLSPSYRQYSPRDVNATSLCS